MPAARSASCARRQGCIRGPPSSPWQTNSVGSSAIWVLRGSEVELDRDLEHLDRGALAHPALDRGTHGVERRVPLLQVLLGLEEGDRQDLALIRPVKNQ